MKIIGFVNWRLKNNVVWLVLAFEAGKHESLTFKVRCVSEILVPVDEPSMILVMRTPISVGKHPQKGASVSPR